MSGMLVMVAPYMGAWIEILVVSVLIQGDTVAPYMGAWIEILYPKLSNKNYLVAPYMGAWIEIWSAIAMV